MEGAGTGGERRRDKRAVAGVETFAWAQPAAETHWAEVETGQRMLGGQYYS